MSQHKLLHKTKNVLHRATPGHLTRGLSTRQVITRFANDLGFVYFGYVDQADDEHRLLRGMTVSRTHSDQHYSVGTFKGYDMALVVRRDTLEYPDKRLKDHHWTIMTFDLHTYVDVPHFYVGHSKIREELLARYSSMIPLQFGHFSQHSQAFLSEYTVYSSAEHAVDVEQILTPDLTAGIAAHFKDLSVELSENTLYLYATEKHPSRTLLERMTNNGVWLAQAIDASRQQFNQMYM